MQQEITTRLFKVVWCSGALVLFLSLARKVWSAFFAGLASWRGDWRQVQRLQKKTRPGLLFGRNSSFLLQVLFSPWFAGVVRSSEERLQIALLTAFNLSKFLSLCGLGWVKRGGDILKRYVKSCRIREPCSDSRWWKTCKWLLQTKEKSVVSFYLSQN